MRVVDHPDGPADLSPGLIAGVPHGWLQSDWAAGAVPGWADRGLGGPPAEAAAGALDPEAFDSVEELEQLGASLGRALMFSLESVCCWQSQ